MKHRYLEFLNSPLTSLTYSLSSGTSLSLEGLDEILDRILRVVGERRNEGDSLCVVIGVEVPHHDSLDLRYLALVDVLTIEITVMKLILRSDISDYLLLLVEISAVDVPLGLLHHVSRSGVCYVLSLQHTFHENCSLSVGQNHRVGKG